MAGTKIFFFLYILCMIALPAAGASYKRCAKDQASEVTNGQIMCSFSGCRLECAREYKLQGGKRRIYITCNQDTGQFMYNNKPWRQTAPKCVPNCRKGCQNGGTCIAPSQCQCGPGFKGETCEVKECPEPSFPDAQANITRDNDELRVECHEGYVLPPGTAPGGVAVCMNGTWDLPDDFRCQPQPCYYPSRSFKNTIMEGDLFSHTLKCPQGFRMKDGRESVALECLEAEWNVQGQGLLQDLDLHCYPV